MILVIYYKNGFHTNEKCLEYKITYIIQFDLILLIRLIPSEGLRENVSTQTACDTEHIRRV